MNGKNKVKFVIIILLFTFGLSNLGDGYAAPKGTEDKQKKQTLETSDFIFSPEFDEDFGIKLVYSTNTYNDISGYTRKEEPLDAFMTYSDKALNFDGVEPFSMKDFLNGTVSLAIDYRMKDKDHIRNWDGYTENVFSLGEIPIYLSREEPYWRLSNRNGSWGVGTGDGPALIPDGISGLLPDSLEGVSGYQYIDSCRNGVLQGSIWLKQIKPDAEPISSITLSSLKLPGGINRAVRAGGLRTSTLEIMANYYVYIPFQLYGNRKEEGRQDALCEIFTDKPHIQGKLTFRLILEISDN